MAKPHSASKTKHNKSKAQIKRAVQAKTKAKTVVETTTKKPAGKSSIIESETLFTAEDTSGNVQLPKLPNIWRISRQAARTIWNDKKVLGGVLAVYGLLNILFVQSSSSNNNLSQLKSQVVAIATGHTSKFTGSLSVFSNLLTSTGSSSDSAGTYQFFLIILVSLAVIWALRQRTSGVSIRIRDAYYRGMYPIVPFILVLLVVGLQLLPLVIGASVYTQVVTNGIAALAIERVIWALVFGGLALLTLYWLSSSLFALYIVTLPDMTPIKALRSARTLVKHRRWSVLRKVVALPVILLLTGTIIMLPVIVIATVTAQWVFFVLSLIAVLATHAYMYTIYRQLLVE